MTDPPPGDELLDPERVAAAIRAGRVVADRAFDRFLPFAEREVSELFWSRIEVARRSAEWFDELGIGSVVDVGSGCGKFCVVAALASSARFVGIEHRGGLVTSANALAARFGVAERVRFTQATFGHAEIPTAQAYYFFNPFGENILDPEDRLDTQVELGDSRYLRDVALAEQFLEAAPSGTFVLTYNGFGGEIPKTFERLRVDRELPSVLSLWKKS